MSVPEEELNGVYTSRELIDMALDGHYLFTDAIFGAVWDIYRRFGEEGRRRMHRLPDVRRYAEEDEIARWGQLVLQLERDLIREEECRKQASEDVHQQRFPWS